jgi:hypothetical protein
LFRDQTVRACNFPYPAGTRRTRFGTRAVLTLPWVEK